MKLLCIRSTSFYIFHENLEQWHHYRRWLYDLLSNFCNGVHSISDAVDANLANLPLNKGAH